MKCADFPDLPASPDSESNPDAAPAVARGIPQLTRVSSAFDGGNPSNPTQPPSPPAGRPLGLFTGEPMPDWRLPPIFDFQGRSGASGKNSEDWLFALLAGPGNRLR